MKKTVGMILSLMLIFTTGLPLYASEKKDETVYVQLDESGTPGDTYVVRHLSYDDAVDLITDTLVDGEIINLVSNTPVTKLAEEMTWQLDHKVNDFYYQITKSNPLPYDLEINYYLEGKKVTGRALAGATGEMKMIFSIDPGVLDNSFYSDHMMAQMSLVLDLNLVDQVITEGGTSVIAGKNLTINYVVLPGSSATFEITFYGKNFSMAGITFSVIPYAMSLPENIRESTKEIDQGFEQLSTGMAGIVDGTVALQAGLTDLAQGVDAYNDGYDVFLVGSEQLIDGVKPVLKGLSPLQFALSTLAESSEAIQTGLIDLSLNASELLTGYTQIALGYEALNAGSVELNLLASGYSDHEDANVALMANSLLGITDGLTQLNAKLGGINAGSQAFVLGIEEMATNYNDFSSGLGDASDGLSQLNQGAALIESQLTPYLEGAEALSVGIGTINDNLQAIPSSMDAMIFGQGMLKDGIVQAKETLNAELSGLMASEIMTVPSYIHGETDAIDSLQFIMKTPDIRVVQEPITEVEEAKGDKSFWERLLDLFR